LVKVLISPLAELEVKALLKYSFNILIKITKRRFGGARVGWIGENLFPEVWDTSLWMSLTFKLGRTGPLWSEDSRVE
jgi:hypothetical protein